MSKTVQGWRLLGAAVGFSLLAPALPALASHEEAEHIEKLMRTEGQKEGEEHEGREESWQIEQRQLWFERTRGLRNAPDAARNRAESVQAALVGKGIDAGRLTAQGFGPDRPLVPETDEASRAKNRRVELVKRD